MLKSKRNGELTGAWGVCCRQKRAGFDVDRLGLAWTAGNDADGGLATSIATDRFSVDGSMDGSDDV